MLNRRHFGIVLCTLMAVCVPASAQNSEPFFSYNISVIVEAEGGGGIAAPPTRPSVPVRGRRPELMTSSDYSALAVDCYSTNGDIPSFVGSSYLTNYEIYSCETASSFNLPLTLTTQQLGASVASVVAGSGTSLSLSMKASPPAQGDITAGSGELDYAQIFVAPAGSIVNLPISATVLGDASASVVASSDSDCETTNCTASVGTSGAGAYPSLNLGPFTVGPSGRYTLAATLSAGVESPGGLPANSSVTLNFCPVNVLLSVAKPTPQYMMATFTAPGLAKLNTYAAACSFDVFNWQQLITNLPAPSPFYPVQPDIISAANLSPPNCQNVGTGDNQGSTCTLIAPPSFSDPPQGTYTYDSKSPLADSYPFYYPAADLAPGGSCTIPLGATSCGSGFPYIVSADGTTLSFVDNPSDPCLPGGAARHCGGINDPAGSVFAFSTTLVGVVGTGPSATVTPLVTWTWQSTFNGTAGGVAQTRSIDPIDPGSGTGNVTITSINGVQLPPVVPASDISATASGLAYSRVTRTFNGTVTITNTSGSAISGPLQILCLGMTTGVTLLNATNNLSGTPYLTVPVADLAPGHSTTVSVQFQNPSNGTINFTPVIYSGSIN